MCAGKYVAIFVIIVLLIAVKCNNLIWLSNYNVLDNSVESMLQITDCNYSLVMLQFALDDARKNLNKNIGNVHY